jgi:hypothetical protein
VVEGFLMNEIKGYVNAQTMLEMLEQYQGCYFPHSAAVHIVNKLVQTDVKPVKRSHWTYKPLEDDGSVWLYHCDACANLSARPRAYCAECGATMEERVEYTNE